MTLDNRLVASLVLPYLDFGEEAKRENEAAVTRTMLQAKLHRARVTHACLDYEGSCGIDEQLLELSGILPNQYIEIYNVSNEEWFRTYTIRRQRESGKISLNGAAARRVANGDTLIINHLCVFCV